MLMPNLTQQQIDLIFQNLEEINDLQKDIIYGLNTNKMTSTEIKSILENIENNTEYIANLLRP